MDFQQKLEILKEKKSEISKLQNDFTNISSELFDEFRGYIFDKYPNVESFGWTQYTPYFNDGDACEFYANTDYLIINGEYAEDSEWFSKIVIKDYGVWNRESKKYEGRVEEDNLKYNENLVDAYNEIVEFLSNFDNRFYLSKFGDHAEIVVSKFGLEISDCDHD